MPRSHRILLATLISVTSTACARTPPPVHVAPTAPQDAPIALDSSAVTELDRLIEPCRRTAMAAYPGARARFRAGLPARHSMFVVTRLRDSAGRREQVFVVVDAIDGERITGRIWNDLRVVTGYQRAQVITVPEQEILDWMVSRPDGTEEGNWIGRFIDALQATGVPPTGICTA